ncbi:fumarylacetoacetate hydrolase family protein [Rarobacter faecitabidus]|uniref:2-keto-4-pentenoate hydratase/2-oxohepta-3-ene-1,7-dioic acid hydratase in catechol pathway n=1 Tax=Rarobacter faecitabidus TaxID=13243 RepID=A0A542ZWW0_RARFA|nr:fumarylacetoacetate hydrolase family protein [Rarobacter faecitabidus]TQL64825.1 2-keto-4-pentenoate hydratase/2-oxohepta-3-ene-1,7-dioic acid hydratase in catechol pathway [Rarobacter faecitabidus]
MRIARFIEGENPRYGFVQGEPGAEYLAVVSGDPLFQPVAPTGERVDLDTDGLRLLAPVIPRSKVVGVGRNYADHAAELGNEPPIEPLLFLKPNTAVVGPDDPIQLPSWSREVHYEAELAVVIGRVARNVEPEDALGHVLGYTVANDVTARDIQNSDDQWTRAKGFDTSCPLGPWISTDVDPEDLRVTTRVNGELRQDATTADLIFDVPFLVSYISKVFTLLPGDVILTGTPAGVGSLKQGDVVECEIEGIGVLRSPVVSMDE